VLGAVQQSLLKKSERVSLSGRRSSAKTASEERKGERTADLVYFVQRVHQDSFRICFGVSSQRGNAC